MSHAKHRKQRGRQPEQDGESHKIDIDAHEPVDTDAGANVVDITDTLADRVDHRSPRPATTD